MQSTRRIMSAVASSAGSRGYLIKPRNQWDTIYSAASSVGNILLDQHKRDSFVETVNKGIINTSVLGQADMGFAITLALHHDLNSPLFKTNDDFDIEQFLEGAEPALERFQEVLYSVDRASLSKILNGLKNELEKNDVGTETGDGADADTAIDADTNDDGDGTSKTVAANGLDNLDYKETVEAFFKPDWKNRAEDDPESLHGQLHAMASPKLFESCETQFFTSAVHCLLNKVSRMEYILDSGNIKNIALLSARANEVGPDETTKDSSDESESESNKDQEQMLDDSFSDGIEKEYPVAAQIEVIYSISQTFRRKRIDSILDTDLDGDESESENVAEDEDEEHELDTAWVAVFEGWLRSDSNNDNEASSLRWKLVDNRPAWEFPGLDMPQ